GINFPSPGAGSQFVAVFALQGVTANPDPNNLVGALTSGVARIYSISNATLESADFQQNPALWTSGTLLAEYAVAVPANVAQGNANAEGTGFTADQINTFSADRKS